MTPQQVNKIIDYFADKNKNDIEIESENFIIHKEENPVFFGSVLAKLSDGRAINFEKARDLLFYWGEFHPSESLQEIASCGYENGYIQNGEFFASECTGEEKRLKDPKARDLFTFLAQFIDDKN